MHFKDKIWGFQRHFQLGCFQLCPQSPLGEAVVCLCQQATCWKSLGSSGLQKVMICLYFCLLHRGRRSQGLSLDLIHLWVSSAPAENWAHTDALRIVIMIIIVPVIANTYSTYNVAGTVLSAWQILIYLVLTTALWYYYPHVQLRKQA